MAQPFDPARRQTDGSAFPVADGLVEDHFSASQNGTIVYRTVESEVATLVWFDRDGARVGTLGEPAEYRQVALSPSGARVVVVRGATSDSDLWIADSKKGVFSRVTRTPGAEHDPTWSPDERYVAYSYIRRHASTMQPDGIRRLELPTGADTEFATRTCQYVDDWTHDNRFVICRGTGALWAVPTERSADPIRLRDDYGDQWHVSADGRLIAYQSDETGEMEVYVAPFPRMVPPRQVSVGGGVQPLWRQDGRELFYLTPNGTLMSVGIRTGPAFEADTPKPLFRTNLVPADGWAQYSVTPDGQRFLVKEPGRQFFTVLQNWLPHHED
jgi:dipeptidyl aminopeptidase/acylaminoacyl peptidase